MNLRFEVGTHERHTVVFTFDKVGGLLTITVDGTSVTRERHLMSLSLVKRYQFTVGHSERHHVVIEKRRKRFLAPFRPQICRAYVDGQLVAEQAA